ncbi:MAG: hypothetical protein EXR93_08860 [Gemmatimonadetes bacterium]|nr:hypothetical protein [Gemmatimonadota bacterium]
MKVLGLGLALTAVVSTIEYLAWGPPAVVPAVSFGLLATGIQVVAVWSLKKGLNAPYAELMKRWAVGLGLRMGGVVLFVVAVLVDRALFPPLPAAFGYLGVVVPLLFAETKLAK